MKIANLLKIGRRRLAFLLLAFLVVGGFLFWKLSSPAGAAWFDDSWAYRQVISVTNNTSGQNNYQLQVIVDSATLISAGKMRSDCGDIRFTDANGQLLSYWNEFCSTTGKSSVWVTVTTLPAGASFVYLYYGNPGVSAVSQYASYPSGINLGTGNDGAVTVSTNKIIDTGNQISGRSCADGGDAVHYTVTASVSSGSKTMTLSSTPSAGCLAVGDEVLIINLRGTVSNYSNVGQYETARITATSYPAITINHPLVNGYDGTTQKIVVQRVPNYASLTVSSGVSFTASSWNGTAGGIVFFRVSGTATITGAVNAQAIGYTLGPDSGFCNATGNAPGESTAGNSLIQGGGGYASGYCSWSGLPAGGGGGYGTAGTVGGAGSGGSAGAAGGTYGAASLATLYFGSGGGDGVNWNGGAVGGNGGGIVGIFASSLTVSGAIEATGSAGVLGWGNSYSGRGGGAGGSVYLAAASLSLGSNLVTATGGAGGPPAGTHATGGAGGSGRIAVAYSTVSGSTNPAANTSTVPVAGVPASEEKTQGPVAYWKFDEGTGTITADSTAGNNAGTRAGAIVGVIPTWQTEDLCVSGKCLFFEGSSAKVTVSNTVNNVQTLSMWVKYASSSGTIPLASLTSTATVTVNGATGVVTAGAGFTSPSVYVNGVLNGTAASNNWNLVTVTTGTGFNANAISIGLVGTTYLKGFADEVKLYNYARGAVQVQMDYNVKSSAVAKGAGTLLGAQTTDPLNNGLVGYWKMEDTSDSSGNGLTLTNNGSLSFTAGKFGNGANATVNTKYLSTTTAISGVKTVAFWINPNATTTYPIDLNGTQTITATTGTITANNFTGATIYVNGAVSTTLVAGSWQHVVVTTNTSFNTGTMTIGLVGSSTMNGTIDDVRIYNRVLTPAEVSQLYNWAPGPLAYYKFDEGSGQAVGDSSGNGNTGTWNGTGSHWTSGKYGKAGNFNGSDDQVTISDTSSLRPSTITVEAWFKTGATSGALIDKSRGAGAGSSYLFFVGDLIGNGTCASGKIGIHFFTGTWKSVCSSSTYNDNQWHFLTATYDLSNIYLYVDGLLSGQSTYSTAINYSLTDVLAIGYYKSAANSYLNANVDEVRIYNYARTQKQIVSDMNGGHPAVGSPVGSPVGYWKFDEGYGSTAYDSSGHSNSGTLTNTPQWVNDGKFGKALKFNGSNTYVNIPNSSPFNFERTDSFSVSAWINSNVNVAANGEIFAKVDTASPYTGYEFQMYSGKLYMNLINTWVTNTLSVNTVSTVSDGKWHHVVVVYSGTSSPSGISIYIDAVPATLVTVYNTLSASIQYSVAPAIGGKTDNTGSFPGRLDEVKVYNYALTASEILTEYNHGSVMVLGSFSDTSSLTGGSVASNSASAIYCVPGDTTTCNPPVGEWNFEEGVGGTANDSSGNSNTGTWNGTGAAHWVPGKFGKAGNFNGTDDFVNAGNGTSLQIGNPMTLEVWLKPAVLNPVYYAPVAKMNAGATTGFEMVIGTGTSNIVGQFGTTCHGAYNSAVGQTILQTNTWYHMVGTFDGTTIIYYLNGKIEGTTSCPFTMAANTTDPLTIGKAASGYFFNGAVDGVRVFNYVRTPAQIAWDYSRGNPETWWKFDECQGTVAHDSVGTVSGTLNSGTPGTCATSGTAWFDGKTGKNNYSLAFGSAPDLTTVTSTNTYPISIGSYSPFQYLANKYGSWGGWFKPTSSTANQGLVDKDNQFRIYTDGSGNAICSIYNSGAYQDATSVTAPLTLNTWNHVVCTYDGTNIKTYVNGLLKNTTANANGIADATSNLRVGQISGGTPKQFTGQADDVKIWRYPMTAVQVMLEMNQASAVRFGPSQGSP